MSIINLFETQPWLFITSVALLGACVGSFLNVVIYRLPIMMERAWRAEYEEYTEENSPPPQETFNLAKPASTCPKCQHKIRSWENIPVISYLFLRGKCSSCATPISLRYPVIEIVSALLSIIVAWHYGPSWAAAAALCLTWALIALTMIDFDHQLLPDVITLPFLWMGLALGLFGVFVDIETAVIGAMAGYLSLWSVYWLFKLVTGKEGMGFGDFKLLALLGAWMGWQAVPIVILMSSLVGAVVGIALVVFGRNKDIPIPFGPYLAAAGFITLIWGDQITQTYLSVSGLS